MNTINSRASTLNPNVSVYLTSESRESGWGQPPASHYVFTYQGNRLVGRLITTVDLPASLHNTSSAVTNLRMGMLRPDGILPSDQELKDDYTNYLIEKYE